MLDLVLDFGLGLGLGLGLWLGLDFIPSSPIVRELSFSVLRGFPLVRFRHNPSMGLYGYVRMDRHFIWVRFRLRFWGFGLE